METRKILISDETLRDGQQQPYVVFNSDEMLDLALAIADLGPAIYNIDIMPSMHQTHREIAEVLVESNYPITLATVMKREAIEQMSNIGQNIITISSLSDSLMAAKDITRSSNMMCTLARLEYAKRLGLKVGLAGEGSASKDADLGFVVEYLKACQDKIDYFIYCDTDGRANPEDTEERISYLKAHTSVPILMHCHNDLGRAVENTIAGILAGAEGMSSTFTGIGDRAGNAPTETVLSRLRDDHKIVAEGVDYEKLQGIAEKVRAYAGIGPAQPGSELSYVHEAGIHVDALLKAAKKGICIYGTEPGLARVVVGISSGLATMELIYRMYCMDFKEEEARNVLLELKNRALREKTSFSELRVYDAILDYRNAQFIENTRRSQREMETAQYLQM